MRSSCYVSPPLLFGNAASAEVGSVLRIPAHEAEEWIRTVILQSRFPTRDAATIDCALVSDIIARIEVRKNQLVRLKQSQAEEGADEDQLTVIVPWTKPPSRMARSILGPASAKLPRHPMKLEQRATFPDSTDHDTRIS